MVLLNLEAFRQTPPIQDPFGLSHQPLLITVRGRCRKKDGQVHLDTAWKMVTALISLNDRWGHEGGRLRLLRSRNRGCGS